MDGVAIGLVALIGSGGLMVTGVSLVAYGYVRCSKALDVDSIFKWWSGAFIFILGIAAIIGGIAFGAQVLGA